MNGALLVVIAEGNRRMPKLTVAANGRIHVQLIGRTPAPDDRMNAPIVAMNGKVNAVIVVMIDRTIEVIVGKMVLIAGKTAASFLGTTMWVEKLPWAMRYMIVVTDGENTGMIDWTIMKITGTTTISTTILPTSM